MEFSEHTKWIEKAIKDRAAFLIILNRATVISNYV